MEKDDKKILLSIVISTYNRSELLMNNLNRMMQCKSGQIEFIVGDNASSDDTVKKLKELKDSRLHIVENTVNYGISNAKLLSRYVTGKYFMYLNDRDYIRVQDLESLCKQLENVLECQMIICGTQVDGAEGYQSKKLLPLLYFRHKHPGWIVFLTKYYHKCMDYKKIFTSIEKGGNINWMEYDFLRNIKKGYVIRKNYVQMPSDISKVRPERKEPFGDRYFLPKSSIRNWDAFLEGCGDVSCNPMGRIILYAKYEDLLLSVTKDYLFVLRNEAFASRYGCSEYKTYEWIKNGIVLMVGVLKNKRTTDEKMKKKIVYITLNVYSKMFKMEKRRMWKQ